MVLPAQAGYGLHARETATRKLGNLLHETGREDRVAYYLVHLLPPSAEDAASITGESPLASVASTSRPWQL